MFAPIAYILFTHSYGWGGGVGLVNIDLNFLTEFVKFEYWDKKLIETVESSETLKYVDTSYVTTLHPMRVWQMAGLCSDIVKHAAVVIWMSMGIYFTQELWLSAKYDLIFRYK